MGPSFLWFISLSSLLPDSSLTWGYVFLGVAAMLKLLQAKHGVMPRDPIHLRPGKGGGTEAAGGQQEWATLTWLPCARNHICRHQEQSASCLGCHARRESKH